MKKKGSGFRIATSIIGGFAFMGALYFLDREDAAQAAIFGMIGIVLLGISLMPIIAGTIRKK